MKDLISGLLALVLAVPLQRIEMERPDRFAVKRVETAMNHLTVIELAEPITMAAAGSPSFKIERQGNKVLVQPIEDGAATNLFIWTKSGRFAYELVPATSIETTDFVIDQQIEPRTDTKVDLPVEQKSRTTAGIADEIIRSGNPIKNLEQNHDSRRVAITISDILQTGDGFFVRYTIDNPTGVAFASKCPEVYVLQSPQFLVSLYVLRYTQLDQRHATGIRSKGMQLLPVADSRSAELVESGQRKSGILSLSSIQRGATPTVLRLIFPTDDANQPISVTVVL